MTKRKSRFYLLIGRFEVRVSRWVYAHSSFGGRIDSYRKEN